MGPWDALNHLFNFVAPAAALALVLTLGGAVFRSKTPLPLVWWARVAIIFIVGVAVLVAGLVVSGRDGRMWTYAAVVVACATCQWVLVRGWRA